ncbi:PEPxxWA-CTERM sorting domain-containing protein [Novosphingobium sp. G106]|uniref:PEPxxWA-CTERM sorting domain-containing protein n=1 Tax=Novosphingobium sp. G106 TaxID=2849500 RepID=UPI0020C371A7|nr:PEPxxWA-CTERM sorting domain-containing protein [Novosphingobium sp. G106]
MRVVTILAAAVALWAMPASAAVLYPNISVNVAAFGVGTRIEFALLDPLPPGTQLNFPRFNQYASYKLVWAGDHTTSAEYTPLFNYEFVTRIVEQTPTSFIIDYGATGDYADCGPSSVIGEVCGFVHEGFSNSSNYPVTTPDFSQTLNIPLRYTLITRTGAEYNPTIMPPEAVPEPATWALMIMGIGLAGSAMRRRQRHAVSYKFV